MVDYPANFVLPRYDTYSGIRESGLLRSAAPTPEPNQIKTFNSAITQLNLSFAMSKTAYAEWEPWVRANAYDWFVMPVVGPHAPDYITSDSRVRFISDIGFNYAGHDWYEVNVSAELVPNDVGLNSADKVYLNFIISGTPGSPAVDIIDSGTPANPAVDIIYADLYEYEFQRV